MIIFLPLGEFVCFFAVKIKDFGKYGGGYLSRCRTCRHFMHFEGTEGIKGVSCKASGSHEIRTPEQANICVQYKKSAWL